MNDALKTKTGKYQQNFVDRDGFVLVAFTLFSLVLLGFSIYMSNGFATHYGTEQTEAQSAESSAP